MNTGADELYYCIVGGIVTLTVLGLITAVIMPGIDRWNRRFFIAEFLVLVVYAIICLFDIFNYGKPNMELPLIIAWFWELLFLAIPLPMFSFYLVHYCEEDLRNSMLIRAVLAVWCIYAVLLGSTQFLPWFYYMNQDGLFEFGPWYLFGIAPIVVMLAINTTGVIRRRNRMPVKYYRTFLVYLLPQMISYLVYMIVHNLLIISIGAVLSTLAMYGNILFDQIEHYTRQQQEIANQRARIAILQMRPHFIYNTMTSIYYLCDMDPKRAKQVTIDFTTYLRKNFFAIASETTIPFSEELEHTRAYLAVEQAQFEDALLVCYDTPHTQFRVPPLTLQPIVENAVQHGMDPEVGLLHVSIKTERTDQASTIVVADDGSGFDPAVANDPHTTLANIRQRIEMMCGGTLTIKSQEGSGCTVRVTIPHSRHVR